MTGAGGGGGTAVVVVSHDTRDEVLACVPTLWPAGADEVVVVDSGSSDGTSEAVATALPDVRLLTLPNVGYGRGANAGFREARADVVVIANADTRFDPGAVDALAAALRADPDVGAVGPKVVYPDGRPQASARSFPSLRDAALHALLGLWWPSNPATRRYRMLDADPDVGRDVDWLSGCAFAVRRDAFEDVGGFDEGYFMYVEDVDLGLRLRRAGWRVRYVPAAVVEHRVGASTSRRPARMVVEHARSLDRFYARRYPRSVGRLLRPLVRVGLGAWVGIVLAWHRVVGRRRGRSSTGE